MTIALIIVTNLLVLSGAWITWREYQVRLRGNQESKLRSERDEAVRRYDDIVQSIKAKASGVKEIAKPKRVARTFSEFRDADERGVVPRGMREKMNANL